MLDRSVSLQVAFDSVTLYQHLIFPDITKFLLLLQEKFSLKIHLFSDSPYYTKQGLLLLIDLTEVCTSVGLDLKFFHL